MSVSAQDQFYIRSRLQKVSALTQCVQKLSHREKSKMVLRHIIFLPLGSILVRDYIYIVADKKS